MLFIFTPLLPVSYDFLSSNFLGVHLIPISQRLQQVRLVSQFIQLVRSVYKKHVSVKPIFSMNDELFSQPLSLSVREPRNQAWLQMMHVHKVEQRPRLQIRKAIWNWIRLM